MPADTLEAPPPEAPVIEAAPVVEAAPNVTTTFPDFQGIDRLLSKTPPAPKKEESAPDAKTQETKPIHPAAKRIAEKEEKRTAEALRLELEKLQKERDDYKTKYETEVPDWRTKYEEKERAYTDLDTHHATLKKEREEADKRWQNEHSFDVPLHEDEGVKKAQGELGDAFKAMIPAVAFYENAEGRKLHRAIDQNAPMRNPELANFMLKELHEIEQLNFAQMDHDTRSERQLEGISRIAQMLGIPGVNMTGSRDEWQTIAPDHPFASHVLSGGASRVLMAARANMDALKSAQENRTNLVATNYQKRVEDARRAFRDHGIGLPPEEIKKRLETRPDDDLLQALHNLSTDKDAMDAMEKGLMGAPEVMASIKREIRPLPEKDLTAHQKRVDAILKAQEKVQIWGVIGPALAIQARNLAAKLAAAEAAAEKEAQETNPRRESTTETAKPAIPDIPGIRRLFPGLDM